MKNSKKHVLVVEVDNNPGVVSRIAGLFTRRGYNIESLVTGVTRDPSIYSLVISLIASDEEVHLLSRQLARIMEVVDVYETGERDCVTRELMFIRIECDPSKRAEVIKIADAMRCETVGVGQNSVVVQATGDDARLESAMRAFEHLGITQTVRSGTLAIEI